MSNKRSDIGIFTCMYRESNVRGLVLQSVVKRIWKLYSWIRAIEMNVIIILLLLLLCYTLGRNLK